MSALNLITGAQNKTAKERERVKELPTIGDVWELVTHPQKVPEQHRSVLTGQRKSHTEGATSRVC